MEHFCADVVMHRLCTTIGHPMLRPMFGFEGNVMPSLKSILEVVADFFGSMSFFI